MMGKSELIHVAIAPPAKLEGKLIEQVAAIISKDLYQTRLHLTGTIPRIISHFYSMEMAELTAQKLRALNLLVIVCKDSELSKRSPVYRAYSLKLEGEGILFHDKSGQAKRIDTREMFLIITGRVRSYTETEEVTTRMKFSLPRTMLTGLPIWRKVKEVKINQSPQTKDFIRLYGRNSLEPNVEILKHDFDYSFLGANMTSSSTLNFTSTVNKIKCIFSQAIFDDKLTVPLQADMSSSMPPDIEINCKLICLYHQALDNSGSRV
jgi:hypothetical protein